MRKSLIGITATLDPDKNIILRRQYCEAVARYGGIPVVLPPIGEPEEILDHCSGIILSGGGDIAPELFGITEYDRTLVRDPMLERDYYELALAKLAYERGMPTLGICRGIQIMNVALGGTLHLDIPSHSQTLERSQPSHSVTIEAHSHLRRIIPAQSNRTLSVNSFHHQAVDRTAPMLTVCAISSDSIIEAIEARDDRFYIGVQWHPEHMPNTSASAPIAALIEAAHQKP